MKKIAILAAAILSSGFLCAQTDQGALFLGGNGSYSRNVAKDIVGGSVSFEQVQIDLSVTPLVGYFIMDGIVVGGQVTLESQRSFPKGSPDLDSKFGTFLVGPFARYYHSSDFFGEALLGFGNTGSEGFKSSLFNWSAGIGKAIFFNEFVAIEPMIVFTSTTLKFDGAGPDDKLVTSGPGIKLGFAIFIQ